MVLSPHRFEASEDGNQVFLCLHLSDDDSVSEEADALSIEPLTVEQLKNQFSMTEFRGFFLLDEALPKYIKLSKGRMQASVLKTDSEQEPIQVLVAEKRDAIVRVDVSEDKMSSHIVIETAYGAVNPTALQLQQILSDNGVVQGILSQKLESLARQMGNVGSGVMLKELIAEGTPAGQSKQAKINVLVQPIQDRLMKPQLRDNGTVDMHDFGEIEMVNPGDELLRRVPPVIGKPGIDVLGNVVAAVNPEDRLINVGDGTELSAYDSNLLIACRKGVPLKIDNGMMVEDAYCVNDVDLRTGNIEFDGTVVVQGSIKDGMQVKATGKIMVRDYIESAVVESGGDLIIGKGILGRQGEKTAENESGYSAHVRCSGNLHCNYMQYAQVSAEGDVSVAKHVMHCDVTGKDIIVESPKKSEGKIIGGVVHPRHILRCNTLGALSYIQTQVDFSPAFAEYMAELVPLNDELSERLNVVRGMKEALRQLDARAPSNDFKEQETKITNTIQHFRGLIDQLKAKRETLMQEIETIKENLEIEIKREIFPGVSVRFLHKDIPIKQEKKLCRIKPKDDGLGFFAAN